MERSPIEVALLLGAVQPRSGTERKCPRGSPRPGCATAHPFRGPEGAVPPQTQVCEHSTHSFLRGAPTSLSVCVGPTFFNALRDLSLLLTLHDQNQNHIIIVQMRKLKSKENIRKDRT